MAGKAVECELGCVIGRAEFLHDLQDAQDRHAYALAHDGYRPDGWRFGLKQILKQIQCFFTPGIRGSAQWAKDKHVNLEYLVNLVEIPPLSF